MSQRTFWHSMIQGSPPLFRDWKRYKTITNPTVTSFLLTLWLCFCLFWLFCLFWSFKNNFSADHGDIAVTFLPALSNLGKCFFINLLLHLITPVMLFTLKSGRRYPCCSYPHIRPDYRDKATVPHLPWIWAKTKRNMCSICSRRWGRSGAVPDKLVLTSFLIPFTSSPPPSRAVRGC